MLLEEVSAYLQAQGLGTVGVDLFLSRLDDTAVPAQATALYEYPGAPPAYVLSQLAIHLEEPRLHVRCRAEHYVDARLQAEAIVRALGLINNVLLSGVLYWAVMPLATPYALPPDALERPLIGVNFRVLKAPSL